MEIEQLYSLYSQNFKVDTDTRKIRNGSIFFALKGENFNGNKFALDALKKGADYAVIDEKQDKNNPQLILVDDVLKTLQKLANFHRKRLNIPIIALTGSNGKTTTKELINAVLSQKFKVTATEGNLNNHIGVPLTLLSMTPATEIGIVEMGANHLKELEFSCKIAEPNYGYITNFGKAHLEGFGGEQGVIKGKSELYNYLKACDGIVFINQDDNIQVKQSAGIKKIAFDSKIIQLIHANPFVISSFKNITIKSQLIGKYNFTNISAAIAIGNYFSISPDKSSMAVAIENFNQLDALNKIVFLGDMFELGKSSNIEHQKIADLVTSLHFNKVYLIGKAFSTVTVKNAFQFESFEAFKKSQNYINVNNTSILVKGSRGMALERLLDLLQF